MKEQEDKNANQGKVTNVTVRELNIYYRKNKKNRFNKVLRFKTKHGNIEHVFDILKKQEAQKSLALKTEYLLN